MQRQAAQRRCVWHTKALPEAERKSEIAAAAWKEFVLALDALATAMTKSRWLANPESFRLPI